MARQAIPLEDKEKIIKALAAGKSYEQAKEGTSIRSKGTVANIVKENMNEIEQRRANYLAMIESFSADDIDRAELWAEMTRATKVVNARLMVTIDGKVHADPQINNDFIEVPDWQAREKALKYIDQLAGYIVDENSMKPRGGDTYNFINVNSPEVVRFNGEFKSFLENFYAQPIQEAEVMQ